MTTELQSRPIHCLTPQCSEDGRWWWDGVRWVEVTSEHSWRWSVGRALAFLLAVLLFSLLFLAV